MNPAICCCGAQSFFIYVFLGLFEHLCNDCICYALSLPPSSLSLRCLLHGHLSLSLAPHSLSLRLCCLRFWQRHLVSFVCCALLTLFAASVAVAVCCAASFSLLPFMCVCVFQVNGKRTRNSQHATATTTTTYVANILFFPYPLIPPFATLLASLLACLSLRVVRFLVLVLYFILFYCSCIFCFFLLLLFWAVSTLLCFTSSANLLLLLRQRGGSERRRVTLCVCA